MRHILVVAAWLFAAQHATADLATNTIFTHGERDDCVCIRIPTLLLVQEVLVVFADCIPLVGDNCQPTRPHAPPPGAVRRQVYKRSMDGGSTWGALTNSPELGGEPVVLHNGTLLLLSLSSSVLWRSDDGAGTWTRTATIHSSPASGVGGSLIQLAHTSHPHRLVSVRKGPGGVGEKSALTSYSDDFGLHWHGSTTQQAHMDETELVELADGTVAMLSRNWLNCSSIGPDAPCRQHQYAPLSDRARADRLVPHPRSSRIMHTVSDRPTDAPRAHAPCLALCCAVCRDGPCMCTAIATSDNGGESFDGPSVPTPSLAGANCHGAALTLGAFTYFAGPMYTGPPRLPNPPQPPCAYDPESRRTGHCYTDRAPNRVNGTIMVANASSAAGVREWRVHTRVTIGSACTTVAECDESAGFGYSSLAALPQRIWPQHFAIVFETTSPDCGYDPEEHTATGIGSATSACKIVMAVVRKARV